MSVHRFQFDVTRIVILAIVFGVVAMVMIPQFIKVREETRRLEAQKVAGIEGVVEPNWSKFLDEKNQEDQLWQFEGHEDNLTGVGFLVTAEESNEPNDVNE